MATLTFLGGAGTVTGSRYLSEAGAPAGSEERLPLAQLIQLTLLLPWGMERIFCYLGHSFRKGERCRLRDRYRDFSHSVHGKERPR